MEDQFTGYNWWQKLKIAFFRKLKLNTSTTLKIYTGYSNGSCFIIFGHVLSLSPIPRKKYKNVTIINTLALLRLFFVQLKGGREVTMHFDGETHKTKSQKDGFFIFEWETKKQYDPGVYHCDFELERKTGKRKVSAQGKMIVPSATSFAFISDIDDTFLISHSSNLRKRLFVLFTENAHSRRPFEGAVNHYRLLGGLDDEHPAYNTFFYVSSSEWNLYDYIAEFIEQNHLPEGIMLLSQIKTFSGLLKTGQTKHEGKFIRITRILKQFPRQKFVLLGDDTQQDPFIYESIVKNFPENIVCVYIRRVGTPEKEHVLKIKTLMESKGIPLIYFAHSEDAIAHSISTGLIESARQ